MGGRYKSFKSPGTIVKVTIDKELNLVTWYNNNQKQFDYKIDKNVYKTIYFAIGIRWINIWNDSGEIQVKVCN